MSDDNLTTGSVVRRYMGADGEEIAVVVRLPASTWKALAALLLEPDDDADDVANDHTMAAESLESRIASLVDLTVQEWVWRLKRHVEDGDLDDDVPF